MKTTATLTLLGILFPVVAGCASAAQPAAGGPSIGDGCPKNTGYRGDENCIRPPPTAEGFQLHYGPKNHDDPAEVAKYVVEPGQEAVNCYALKTGNEADVFSSGHQFHMRPGSHHLIAETQSKTVPDGPLSCGAVVVSPGQLGGTQLQIDDSATNVAPENEGLAIKIAAKTQAVLNFHVVNTTETPLLSEAWLNYDYADEISVTGMRGAVFLVGGLGFRIDPGTTKTYQYSCSPTQPTRILQLAAHMHMHASRMTAWKVSGGVRTKILESFSWEEPGTVYFDSTHTNPTSDAAAMRTGADVSGDLTVDPTESIQWECEVDNNGNAVLAFRNEVVTGEMCVVTGAQVRADDPMKLTDFTCVRN